MLEQQEAAIRDLQLSNFTLTTARLNSFTGVPFIEVVDTHSYLQSIHHALYSLSGADWDGPFVPHLTVRLYRDNFPTIEIAEILQKLPSPQFSIDCTRLCLLAYTANDTRSPLICLREISMLF